METLFILHSLGLRTVGTVNAEGLHVRELAHLPHGVTAEPADGRVRRGVPVDALGDIDRDTPTEPVEQTSAEGDDQQLHLLADKHGRSALGEVAPQDFVGPLLVRNERNIVGVA
jgi:hypothetical protein